MKKFKHGGNIQDARRRLKTKKILDFSANINPLGLSDKINCAIKKHLSDIVHYPEAKSKELKKVIAKNYHINKKSVVASNGATELFYALCKLLKPKRTFVPVPGFLEYQRASIASGSKLKEFVLTEKTGFEPNLAELCKKLKAGDMLFLGNPNNPTGTILNKNDFTTFLQTVTDRAYIVVDESFIDFLPSPKDYSMRSLCNQHKNLIIIHSLTKFFAIPGLRLGFGIFDKKLAKKLDKTLDCWNVNSLAQQAGIAALKDGKYIKKSRRYLIKSRTKFVKELSKIKDFKITTSKFNYLLINIQKTRLTAEQFCAKMFAQKILVRNCSNFKTLEEGFVRIAVKSIKENKLFIKSLKKVLKEEK